MDEIRIRRALPDEYERVRSFYHTVTEALQNSQYGPGWKKDIYPAPDELRSAIAEGSLFVAEECFHAAALNAENASDRYLVASEEPTAIEERTSIEEPTAIKEPNASEEPVAAGETIASIESTASSGIIAAMVINSKCNEAYNEVSWPQELEEGEYVVIHMLGVHPALSGRGIAKTMVRYAIGHARSLDVKAIRLDVLEGNIPAEKLYTGLGFTYVDKLMMYYDDTGWTNYMVYEYDLNDMI